MAVVLLALLLTNKLLWLICWLVGYPNTSGAMVNLPVPVEVGL